GSSKKISEHISELFHVQIGNANRNRIPVAHRTRLWARWSTARCGVPFSLGDQSPGGERRDEVSAGDDLPPARANTSVVDSDGVHESIQKQRGLVGCHVLSQRGATFGISLDRTSTGAAACLA